MQTSRQNYTAGQLAYEYVIQFGDHNSLDVNEVIADKYLYEDTVEMFREFIDNYQESYPHMKIVLATVHMDEPKGTPICTYLSSQLVKDTSRDYHIKYHLPRL